MTTRPLISIIVPCRAGESPSLTLDSLARQTRQDYVTHIITDHRGYGAPWARNFGMRYIEDAKYVLFSDADIRWDAQALDIMVTALEKAALTERDINRGRWCTGYAYGGYYLEEPTMFNDKFKTFRGPIGCQQWDYETLLQQNYISTMSLIATDALRQLGPKPWDESLQRLQDWDLWLKFAFSSWRGVFTGGVTFTTPVRSGVSFADGVRSEHTATSGGISYADAWKIVREKHGLAS